MLALKEEVGQQLEIGVDDLESFEVLAFLLLELYQLLLQGSSLLFRLDLLKVFVLIKILT